MPALDQLRVRALRILSDDRPHAPGAIRWAQDMATIHPRPVTRLDAVAEMQRAGFTLRELSLGAGEVVSL